MDRSTVLRPALAASHLLNRALSLLLAVSEHTAAPQADSQQLCEHGQRLLCAEGLLAAAVRVARALAAQGKQRAGVSVVHICRGTAARWQWAGEDATSLVQCAR